MEFARTCKHLIQPLDGVTVTATADVFVCPWCEIERLERELQHFTSSGIVEIAVRNPSVSEYMEHWEGRTLRAEADRDRLRAALERVYRIARDWRHLSDMRGRVCGIAEAALEPAPAAQRPESETKGDPSMTDEQIKYMVTRFLGWRLPTTFAPDAGISFDPEYNVEFNAAHGKPPNRHEPVGTNLFNAEEAEAMVRYMVDGLPESKPTPAPAAAVRPSAAPSPEGAEAATAGAARNESADPP